MHSREEPSCVPPPRPLRAAPPADECGAGSLARSYQSARPFLPKRRGSLPGMQSATCGRLHAARSGSARRADAQPVTGTHNILQRRGLADHGTRRTPRPDLTKACSETGWPATGEQRGASWQPRVQNTWQRHIIPHLMQNRQLAIRLRVSERSCVRSTHQATPKPRLFSLVVERSLRIDFRRFFFMRRGRPNAQSLHGELFYMLMAMCTAVCERAWLGSMPARGDLRPPPPPPRSRPRQGQS